jgi:hypothetical protein
MIIFGLIGCMVGFSLLYVLGKLAYVYVNTHKLINKDTKLAVFVPQNFNKLFKDCYLGIDNVSIKLIVTVRYIDSALNL